MRVLLVSSRFPLPPWRGNQLRTVQWLDALAGHERLLLSPRGDGGPATRDLGAELGWLPRGPVLGAAGLLAAAAAGRPAQEGLFTSPGSRRRVAEAVRDWRPDLAVVQMVRCGWAADEIGRIDPELPLVFDAIDCMGLHYDRTASLTRPILRPAYRIEATRCRRREAELVGRAAVTTAVSRRDLEALGGGAGGWVVPVAGGAEVVREGRPAGPPTVVLSGNLGYRPTVRAARWFADRVWPGVRERVPSARWVLAGARPAAAIRRLASRPGIDVRGDVADLGRELRQATVAVAPMASGSGVAIKMLEAMAAGVAVVADPWSAAGLEDPAAVAVAVDEKGWVDTVSLLLSDVVAMRDQAQRGTELWRDHYEPGRVALKIREAVAAALEGDR